jgi:hypothetical protein
MASITGSVFSHVATFTTTVTDTSSTSHTSFSLADMTPSTLSGGSSGSSTLKLDSSVTPGPGNLQQTPSTPPLTTQNQTSGNTVMHMPDGSTVVVLGSVKVDTSFSH